MSKLGLQRMMLPRRLVEDGFFADEKTAGAWVMAGKVRVNGRRAKAGESVAAADEISVPGLGQRYVAKGGLKLEAALKAFGVDPAGRACIDAGASTGGFTDCLLQHGAQPVYAVDVGYGQLMGSLRQHPAVINLERTNISDARLLALNPVPTLGTCDLSYLSLTKAVPVFSAILKGQGELICLVKPLFEVHDAGQRRTGELPDSVYEPLLNRLAADLNSLPGVCVADMTHSPVTGNAGTLEFFFYILLGSSLAAPDLSGSIQRSVGQALQLDAYTKPSG